MFCQTTPHMLKQEYHIPTAVPLVGNVVEKEDKTSEVSLLVDKQQIESFKHIQNFVEEDVSKRPKKRAILGFFGNATEETKVWIKFSILNELEIKVADLLNTLKKCPDNVQWAPSAVDQATEEAGKKDYSGPAGN